MHDKSARQSDQDERPHPKYNTFATSYLVYQLHEATLYEYCRISMDSPVNDP